MHSSTDSAKLNFRKSSYSNPNNCVEVADVPGGDAAVRDSMNPWRDTSSYPGRSGALFSTRYVDGRHAGQ